jgi:hypothetical protein
VMLTFINLFVGIHVGKRMADQWWQQHTTANGACGCYLTPNGAASTMRERK